MSGYEGTQSLGVPTVYVNQGDVFRVGGNGISPGTPIKFEIFAPPPPSSTAPATPAELFPGSTGYTTQPAGGNCVVNEEGPFQVTGLAGTYAVLATYTDPNPDIPQPIFDYVARVVVLPSGPAPSPTPTPITPPHIIVPPDICTVLPPDLGLLPTDPSCPPPFDPGLPIDPLLSA